jgi:hypothetical protein
MARRTETVRRLILHIGMPKTGTTSIQESLYYGLRDPRYQYLGLGQVSGSQPLRMLFSADARYSRLQQLVQTPEEELLAEKQRLARALDESLAQCLSRQATPILSGEWCWKMTTAEAVGLRDHIAARGFQTQVIAYLRPLPTLYPSRFQEFVKWGGNRFVPFEPFFGPHNDRDEGDYASIVPGLNEVFGATQVVLRPFERAALDGGCVVRDFCRRLDLPLAARHIRRTNDSLSLAAVRLLYTFYALGPGYGTGPQALHENLLLQRRLSRLEGPPFRFHPTLVEQRRGEIDRQHAVANSHMDVPFTLSQPHANPADSIRDEVDLLRHSPAALAWLARVAGAGSPPVPDDPQVSQWVVHQMSRLRERPPLRDRLGRWVERVRQGWHRQRRGV